MKMFLVGSLFVICSFVSSVVLAQVERPAWQQLELINAQTLEPFSLGGFEGKQVYVEPMATWCGNCRKQLKNVSAAQMQAGEKVVFVALSIEGDLPNEQLAAYAEKQGFDLVFAVATPELLQALTETFGRAIANPPSTPHFVIQPDGSTSELFIGIHSPEEILGLFQN